MNAKRRVVLFGDTLVLSAVGRGLAARRGLRVISLDPARDTALGDLDSLRPCAVILDLSVVPAEAAIDLVRDRPDLLLIGLDPAGDRLLVLSGRQSHSLTTEDLVWLIEARAGVPEGAWPEGSDRQLLQMEVYGEHHHSRSPGDNG